LKWRCLRCLPMNCKGLIGGNLGQRWRVKPVPRRCLSPARRHKDAGRRAKDVPVSCVLVLPYLIKKWAMSPISCPVFETLKETPKEKDLLHNPPLKRSNLKICCLFIQELKQAQEFSSRQSWIMNQDYSWKVLADTKLFFMPICSLVNAGVAIVRSLGVWTMSQSQTEESLVQIEDDVQQGVNSSEAMCKHPQCFW